MKNRKRNARVLVWANRLLLLVLGLGLSGQAAFAQENHAIPRSYLNKGTVHLPIQIDDRVRPQLQEVLLYVKEGPQAPWALKEKVPGSQTYFNFRTTQDGEYWFNVVTVDRAGHAIPADVTKEPPGLIVIIDSTPPQVEAQFLGSIPEGQQVRCDVHDANPDPTKTRFFFQTRDLIWRSLDATNGQPDMYCIPGQAALTGMIRITACDLAGNTATREFNLAALPVANNAQVPVAKANPNVVVIENSNDKVYVTPPPTDLVGTAPRVPVPIGPAPVVINETPVAPGNEIVTNKTSWPPLPQEPIVEPASKTPFAFPSGPEGRPVVLENTTPTSIIPTAAQPDVPAKRSIVNNSHIFLDYQIEQTGVSGVGRVEIWYTRDLGQNWQKLCEDPNRKGQAEADLPGEGVYGVTIVVSNGRGFGANPPKPGDAPDCWIEVDTTKPRAELLNVRSNPNGEDGSLHITWSAKDKNLHTEPIDLYYAVNRQGPWLPIAKGLKNDGLYRWTPAADVGSHTFIRLTVHDKAGNSASSESVQAVTLDDMSRPRSRVVGVTTAPRPILGNGPAPLPPTGN